MYYRFAMATAKVVNSAHQYKIATLDKESYQKKRSP